PIAPWLWATKSTTAASGSRDLGMDACPENTRLRQLARNAASDLPMYAARNSLVTDPALSRIGLTREPSFRLERSPEKTSRRSFFDMSADFTLGFAITTAWA